PLTTATQSHGECTELPGNSKTQETSVLSSCLVSSWLTAVIGSISRVRQQRQDACAHDRHAQLPLVPRARARDAPRQHLGALGHEALQEFHVLVVDVVDLVRAELADL